MLYESMGWKSPRIPKWTYEEIITIAMRCDSINDFFNNHSGVYQAACAMNKIDEIYELNGWIRQSNWSSIYDIKNAAKSCDTAMIFRNSYNGAWNAAKRLGILTDLYNEFNWHHGNRGFNPNIPGILYIIIMKTVTNPLINIGITNGTIRRRYSTNENLLFTHTHSIPFDIGSDAMALEKTLKIQLKQFQYTGDYILEKKKNTEIFTIDGLPVIRNIINDSIFSTIVEDEHHEDY